MLIPLDDDVCRCQVGDAEARLALLLAQPSLDLGVTYLGRTAEQWAREEGRPDLAGMIGREVRSQSNGGHGSCPPPHTHAHTPISPTGHT